jgi:Flp pilus assembly pilin Flp
VRRGSSDRKDREGTSRAHRLKDDESGQSTLEYALLVAFFLLVFIFLERQTTQLLVDWCASIVASLAGPAV